MSRFEAEARELLLRRRRSIAADPMRVADPAARWADYDAAPDARVADGMRRELADIDAALVRIAEGRYGTCLNCGGPMGLQRIRAIPEARYCVACSGQRSPAE